MPPSRRPYPGSGAGHGTSGFAGSRVLPAASTQPNLRLSCRAIGDIRINCHAQAASTTPAIRSIASSDSMGEMGREMTRCTVRSATGNVIVAY